MIVEHVSGMLSGERLDRIVALLADVTRTEAGALVSGGFVRLDGATATVGKVRLRAGQQIEIDPSGISPIELPAPDPSVVFTVVHEDADVVVVDKPVGLVVHPGAGNPDATLVNGLLARYPEIAAVGESARPGIVHRLDAGTSGLMVVARSPLAYDSLVATITERHVERVYLALVWGQPDASSGAIDAPVGRDQRDPLKMAVTATGKPARTQFEVIERFTRPPSALLRCRLETGRTHQIRVHLTATKHPIVGDNTYGGVRPGLTIGRIFLHAAHLAFTHPRSGEPLMFDSPLPADLQQVLVDLRGFSASDRA